MEKTVAIILWRRKKEDREGIVTLRVTESRKSSYKSLKFSIPERLWNPVKQRVRKTEEVDYLGINQKIEEVLAELKIVGNCIEDVATKSASFLAYFKGYIEAINNHGSKVAYQTIYNKLLNYLKAKNVKDVSFEQLTPEFIRGLDSYLHKSLTNNTANHYLKVVSHILNTAIKERKHTYSVHPFISVTYKKEKINKVALSATDIKSIIDIKGNERIENIKQAFLFQLFAQGMRVSDLLNLRWNDIKDDYLEYTMFKTGKQMKIYLNDNLRSILVKQKEKNGNKDFVFNFLSAKDFPSVVTSNLINGEQYKKIHHATVVYNRNLKELQKLAEIKVAITSHIARHTYTNLMLTNEGEKIDVYDIQQALGHSSLSITQNYISGFSTKRNDSLNRSLVSQFVLE